MKHVQHLRPIGGKVWPKRWASPIPGQKDLPDSHHIPMDRLRRLKEKHRNTKGRWRSNRQGWFEFLIWQAWHGRHLHLQSKLHHRGSKP